MSSKWQTWMCALTILFISPAYAESPASTDYVNQQIAAMQAEILKILNARA